MEYKALTMRTLLVGDLRPNSYNPNEMTEAGFEELVSEVRHLGRIPKPVVVRAIDDGSDKYVIVDGEHSWRAANEVGLERLDCEIVEVDDFEAMAQTYKRNRHGSHNPVKKGQMFQKMCSERTTHRAFRLMEWLVRYRIENLRAYVLVVAKLRLPVDVLYQIPLGKTANAKNEFPVLVTVEKWEEMLRACLRSNDEQEQIAIAKSAKRVILKEIDQDLEDLTDPRTLELQQIVNAAPNFIRSSELELREKAYVTDAYIEGVPEEIVLEAKRLTVERLTTRKRILEKGKPDELIEFRSILTSSVERIMDQALREVAANHDRKHQQDIRRQQQSDGETLLDKPAELAQAIRVKLKDTIEGLENKRQTSP